jgi:DNA primase
MRDAGGAVIGIRLRLDGDEKLCMKGSKLGLFIPTTVIDSPDLLITEGETDAAAALSVGLNVVGRPGCGTGTKHLVEFITARRPKRVVIVADNDLAGQTGASTLAGVLQLYTQDVRVITPDGVKDLRAWVNAGATREMIVASISAAMPRKHTIRSCQGGTRS